MGRCLADTVGVALAAGRPAEQAFERGLLGLPRGYHVMAVPKADWHRFFEYVVLELQTGACSNFSDVRARLEELASAIDRT